MTFTDEQVEKAKKCKTLDEFVALAKTEGVNLSKEDAEKYFKATRVGELSDDDLDSVAGGKGDSNKIVESWTAKTQCPFCKTSFTFQQDTTKNGSVGRNPNNCPKCGATIVEVYEGSGGAYFVNGTGKKERAMLSQINDLIS